MTPNTEMIPDTATTLASLLDALLPAAEANRRKVEKRILAQETNVETESTECHGNDCLSTGAPLAI